MMYFIRAKANFPQGYGTLTDFGYHV